jgi:hypothetical protein
MGVGSGDLGVTDNGYSLVLSSSDTVNSEQRVKAPDYIILAKDGSLASIAYQNWPRNSIILRVTQVNTAGTQFRVGYMIEGTHTTIQWSAWVAYDGSFDPSTRYRLMLGYANPYPMWFNKIAVWKEEVSDARILEALS